MSGIRQRMIALGSGLLLLGSTHARAIEALSPDRNYQVIIDRNPFGLKPPPPPPTNAPPPVQQKEDEILLTGITSIGGLKAYFMTKAPQGKQPEYYSLGPDETKDGFEVLGIDTLNKCVRVRRSGTETLMTFASNGVKPPATPTVAPGAPGGAPGGVVGAVAPPGGMPPPVLPNAGAAPTAPGSTPATGAGRIRSIPSRNTRTPPMMGGNAAIEPNQPAPRADPNAAVQDVLMMELQKRANPNVSFPPTPMP